MMLTYIHLVVVIEDIAGNVRGVFALIAQRTAVKAAGGDLDLLYLSVLIKSDLLGTALTGIPCVVCLSVAYLPVYMYLCRYHSCLR